MGGSGWPLTATLAATLLLYLYFLLPGGRSSPLLAATLKYHFKKTKTDDFKAKISTPSTSPPALRPLDPLLVSDKSHPGFGQTCDGSVADEDDSVDVSGDSLAMLYNDSSVLENHHCATAFKLMQKEGCNVLESFGRKKFHGVRRIIVDLASVVVMSSRQQLFVT